MGGIEDPDGAFWRSLTHGNTVGGGGAGWDYRASMSADRINGTFGKSHTVQPYSIRFAVVVRT